MKKLSALIALSLFAATAANAQDGSSCANAIPLMPGSVNTDTSAATGWINTYGPLVSPSNDIVYTFMTGATAPTGNLAPTTSNYAFALYLLDSCAAGAGPTPVGSTATIGNPINLATTATIPNHQYYVAVTGTAAGGPGANGTLAWDANPTLPVTLQSFEIN